MAKIMLFMLLLFAAGANAVQGIKDCHVGANPWFLGRHVDRTTEAEYVLTKPLVVESLNKEGKPSGRCSLAAGEHIVVPFDFDASINHSFATREEKMKLAWIKRCGNPIVSRFRFVVPQRTEVTPVVSVTALPPAKPKSLLAGVNPDFNRTTIVPTPQEEKVVPQKRIVVVMERPYIQPGGCVTGYGDCWTGTGYPGNYGYSYYGYNGYDYHPQRHDRPYSPPQYINAPSPSFTTGPATSGPGFHTGPATPGPTFTTGHATAGPSFTTH
jgi:hypothetical protein